MIQLDELLAQVRAQAGHFVYESGYHSDVWWDLEALCSRPAALLPFVAALAERVREFEPDVVCGPLVEGAFVALLVAAELRCDFAYALRIVGGEPRLFPVTYRLPGALHSVVEKRRVVIVNDVISAGSAVRGAIEHVRQVGGEVVGVASLVVLGETFVEFCGAEQLPLIALYRQEHHLWLPDACPLCAAGGPPVNLAQN